MFFLNSRTAQVLMIEVGNSSSLIILERSMWVTSTAVDRHGCEDSRCQAGKNGSWVMRSIILLLDVWWRGSPVTPRRLEKFCWKIAGVTRLTSYTAPGIAGCRRCLAWSIARGTRTSSLCLTLKYFIQMTIDDWTTSKVSRNEGSWNFHDFRMRPSNRWLNELMADGCSSTLVNSLRLDSRLISDVLGFRLGWFHHSPSPYETFHRKKHCTVSE